MDRHIYTLNIIEKNDIDSNTLKPNPKYIQNVREYLDKLVFMDTNTNKIIPLSAYYDSNLGKFVIFVSAKKTKLVPNTNEIALKKQFSANNPVDTKSGKIVLPKAFIDFFIKDTDTSLYAEDILELRRKYFEELKILEDSPRGCSSCQKNALRKKYAVLISNIKATKEEN